MSRRIPAFHLRITALSCFVSLALAAGARAEEAKEIKAAKDLDVVLLQDLSRPTAGSGWGWIEARGAVREEGDGWTLTFTKHVERPTAYPTAQLHRGGAGFIDPDWTDFELVLDLENLGAPFVLYLRLDDAHNTMQTFPLLLPAGKRRVFRFPDAMLRAHKLRTTCMRKLLLHSFKPPEDQNVVMRGLRLERVAPAYRPPAAELQDFAFPPAHSRWDFIGSSAKNTDDGDAWEITFPQHASGHVQFPTAVVHVDKQSGFLSGDWRDAGLYMDLENPGEFFTMQLRIDNEHGELRTFSIPLAAGERRTHVVSNAWMKESGLSSLACVKSVFLHSTMPSKDQRVIVHSLRVDRELPEAVLARERARLERGREVAKKLPAKSAYRAFLDANIAAYAEAPEKLLEGNADARFDDRLEQAEYFGGFKDAAKEPFRALAIPNTLKLRPEQMPAAGKILAGGAKLAAARGEYESFQCLVVAGAADLEGVTAQAGALAGPKGARLEPELLRLEYIPVILPTSAPVGFGRRGLYPDPLAKNAPFAVPAWSGRSVFWRVKVPQGAAPGVYKGEVTVTAAGVKQSVPVSLEVFAVDLPTDPKLKSCFIYRNEAGKNHFNGAKWTKEDAVAFVDLCREYRINAEDFGSSAVLPWDKVFTVDGDTVTADWTEFDAAVEAWIAKGKNTFLGYYPGWIGSLAGIKNKVVEGQKFRLTGQHLGEKGWADRFGIYIFDEPAVNRVAALRELCDWIHEQDKNNKIILTSLFDNERDYVGAVDIFVPILELYNEEFGKERIAAGDQYWMYTCISAGATRTPNNWKIDFFGTSQRALGWWLYRFGAQGYLYWGLDWWPVSPWKQANTYQDGNGDGYMLYPDPEREGLPYASLRMELQRDGFEEFELLHLLEAKAGEAASAEVRSLLNAEGIIESKSRYNEEDDAIYSAKHRQLLEALSR